MNTRSSAGSKTLNSTIRDLQRIWQVLRDPSVPGLWKWLLPVGAFIYWISPIDLIPFMPIDDLAVVIVAMSIFLQMFGRDAQSNATQPNHDQQSAADNAKTIDTTWRVIDER